MSYISMGLLFGLGLCLVNLIFGIIEEILFIRLHNTKWYPFIAGKKIKNINNTMDVKSVKNKIGF